MKDSLLVQKIIQEVSAYTGIPSQEILSGKRQAQIIRAKHMIMWICQYYTRATTSTIAHSLHLRNHATVLWGTKQLDNVIYFDPAYGNELHKFAQSITQS